MLGYTGPQIFLHILYPQVFKNILPSLTNEFVSLIKESSILMVVGVPELTKVTKDIVARELNPMEMYLICAGLYLIMTSAFSYFARLSEKESA
ncbi:amino acid ABC transporter permease protein [Chlamydia trachomatis]|nr:amino acid ABC transporter permease protein [Chlamydia trachomatis]